MTVKKPPADRKAIAAAMGRTLRASKGKRAYLRNLDQHVKRDAATGRIRIDGVLEGEIARLGPHIRAIEVSTTPKRLTMDQIDRLVSAMQVR